MKESGMEKLIELLNEYGEKNIKSEFDVGVYLEMRTYTKKFIKWLVDNDKIDLLRLDNRIALSEFNKVERVLMALSIKDNPIEFLCEILK